MSVEIMGSQPNKNKYKKWASGQLSGDNGSITGLTFKPKFIIITQNSSMEYKNMMYDELLEDPANFLNCSKTIFYRYKDGSSTTGTAINTSITVGANNFSFDMGPYGNASDITKWFVTD